MSMRTLAYLLVVFSVQGDEGTDCVAPSLLQSGRRAERSEPIRLYAPSTEPYNLTTSGRSSYGQFEQDKILYPILSQVKKGFFVESGAHDGESMSNTLLYELAGWQGLLVEPAPVASQIASKHRKAWVFHGALSTTGLSEEIGFQVEANQRFSHQDASSKLKVRSEPLEKILQVIGVRRVDFWSLDIEGFECGVLTSTDFSQVSVGVLLVELNKSEKNRICVQETLQRHGFLDLGATHTPWGNMLDHAFLNSSYAEEMKLNIPQHLEGLF